MTCCESNSVSNFFRSWAVGIDNVRSDSAPFKTDIHLYKIPKNTKWNNRQIKKMIKRGVLKATVLSGCYPISNLVGVSEPPKLCNIHFSSTLTIRE